MLYLALGSKDQAFALLRQACDQHDSGVAALHGEPWFDPLRSDRRFDDLLRCIGLPSGGQSP